MKLNTFDIDLYRSYYINICNIQHQQVKWEWKKKINSIFIRLYPINVSILSQFILFRFISFISFDYCFILKYAISYTISWHWKEFSEKKEKWITQNSIINQYAIYNGNSNSKTKCHLFKFFFIFSTPNYYFFKPLICNGNSFSWILCAHG